MKREEVAIIIVIGIAFGGAALALIISLATE